MNKKVRAILLIILVLTAIVLIKIFLFNGSGDASQGGSDKKQAENVNIFVVMPVDLANTVSAAGTVRSDMEAQLRPEVSGRVVKINFTEGARVSQGQLLVKLNDADLQAQLKKLEIQKKQAADNELRLKKLLQINGVSQEEYDNASAQLNGILADIELLNAQIEKTEIRAPFDGVAGLRSIDQGQYITPANTIVSIQKVDPLKIDFSVPEQYAPMITLNDSVKFTIKGSDDVFTAIVMAIEPKVDPATRTVSIRARCENSSRKLFPGAFAEVVLSLRQIENALMIPTEAVIPILKGQKVFLYHAGKAVEHKIRTGIRTDEKILVKEGIQAGDTVITTGILNIRDGSPVKILKGAIEK